MGAQVRIPNSSEIALDAFGPAGSGKSTYCSALARSEEGKKRRMEVVNLDPAAEWFDYDPIIDVRDLIEAGEAMEELSLGPNAALLFAMDYLLENSEWLREKLDEEIAEDNYVLFDCPGQIELSTHSGTLRKLSDSLTSWGFRVVSVFIVDSQFLVDSGKFLGATLAALSSMVNLELPHVNVLSKLDLLSRDAKKNLDRYLDPDYEALIDSLQPSAYANLTASIANLISDFSLVRFIPLDLSKQSSLGDLQLTLDNVIQFGEDDDVKTHDFECPDEDGDDQ